MNGIPKLDDLLVYESTVPHVKVMCVNPINNYVVVRFLSPIPGLQINQNYNFQRPAFNKWTRIEDDYHIRDYEEFCGDPDFLPMKKSQEDRTYVLVLKDTELIKLESQSK